MASKTIRNCDICRNEIAAQGTPISLPVAFITEQTEGRPVEPYLSYEKLDVCSPCLKRFLKDLPLMGSGAMGANTYFWKL